MSLANTRVTISVLWLSVLSIGIAAAIGFGWDVSLGGAGTVILLVSLPLLVFIIVFRGRPPQTIAEVIYEARHEVSPTRAGFTGIDDENGR